MFTLQYIWLTIKHKWHVFRAGLKTKAPIWNLIIHDWSKFTPAEAPHYGRQFFGPADDPIGFSMAWLHHQNLNPHHWEYWIPRTGHNRGGYQDGEPLPMPERYVREMVADWLGASRAYEGSYPENILRWKWLNDNWDKIIIHSETRDKLRKVLREYFNGPTPTKFTSNRYD